MMRRETALRVTSGMGLSSAIALLFSGISLLGSVEGSAHRGGPVQAAVLVGIAAVFFVTAAVLTWRFNFSFTELVPPPIEGEKQT